MSNIFIGLNKTCLGVLDRRNRDKDNKAVLEEGGGIEMSTTVLPLRDARSLRFEYLPLFIEGESSSIISNSSSTLSTRNCSKFDLSTCSFSILNSIP